MIDVHDASTHVWPPHRSQIMNQGAEDHLSLLMTHFLEAGNYQIGRESETGSHKARSGGA
jgi:hypothetical protein